MSIEKLMIYCNSALVYGIKKYIVLKSSIEKLMIYCNSVRVSGIKKYIVVNASIEKLMIDCKTGYHVPSVPSTLIDLISYVQLWQDESYFII